MKTAVVFYSLNERCAFVAGEIKALLGADLVRLHTTDEKKRSGIGNFFWAIGMVFGRKKPALKPHTFDPSAYNLIIIGAPVWARTLAPPMQTFVSEAGIVGKKVALFLCHTGDMMGAMEQLRALVAGNEIVSDINFKNTLKNSEEVKRQIADWVKGLAG